MASAIGNSNGAGTVQKHASRGGRPGGRRSVFILRGTLVLGTGFFTAFWLVGAMMVLQAMAPPVSSGGGERFEASLGLRPMTATASGERLVAVTRSFRLSQQQRAEEMARRTAEMAERLGKPVAVASVDPARFGSPAVLDHSIVLYTHDEPHLAQAGTAPAHVGRAVAGVPEAGGEAMLTALVDPTPTGSLEETKAFGLVLAQPATGAHAETAGTMPVPLTRPAAMAKAVIGKEAGIGKEAERGRTAKKELAYAKPDMPDIDDGLGRPVPRLGGSMARTAVYVIDSGLVIMPNGDRLEAHSGIGNMRDNPKYTHVKMRGATPAGTYYLTMREKLFHGVEALRMTPTDGVAPLNRTGLLTHSYLLGPNGNSHGCVAFKNYQPFLKAFKRGEINRMIVVERMGDVPKTPKTLAGLFKRNRSFDR